MCWPLILLPLACCCGNRRGRCGKEEHRNPCRRLNDPDGIFPRTTVYHGNKPCHRKKCDE